MSPDDAEKRVSRLAKALGVLIAARAAIRAAGSHQNRTPPTPEESQAPGSDVDPSKRTVPSSPRAEGLVALLLLLAAVFGFAFTVIYIVLSGDTQLLGVAMGGALLLLAAASSWPASSWCRRRPRSRSEAPCSWRSGPRRSSR